MNLLEIRQEFVKKSGRYDLAETSTGSTEDFDVNSGADFYIQGACKYLDLEQEQQEMLLEAPLSTGNYQVELQDCRSISRVTFLNAEGEESDPLSRYTFGGIVATYPKLASEDIGTPTAWAIFPSARPPIQKFSGSLEDISTIIVMPPTDAAVTIKVYGHFYSSILSNNMDTNYWSVNWPNVLIMATLRELEIFYRNSAGVADYDKQIDRILFGVDKDLASIDASDTSIEMEG